MSKKLYAALDRLPRVQFAQLPTPITPLRNLSAALGGPQIYIKRDDQTGLATGGNKARKLEFLLAQALAAGADCVITAGSTQSNHARQTAAGAARLQLDAHLVLYAPASAPPTEATGNLLLNQLLDAKIHWTDERAPYAETIAQVRDALFAEGRRPFVIPYGGSNAFGVMGYVDAMRELCQQIESPDWFDVHVFATSSGGTQAGMILGSHLAGIPESIRLMGISVDRPAEDLTRDVVQLAAKGAEILGLRWTPPPERIVINDHYTGGGYAVVGEPERKAIRLMAKYEGILLDPVYTGRAFAGLLDLIRHGKFSEGQRILFWHTGGIAGLFAFGRDISHNPVMPE